MQLCLVGVRERSFQVIRRGGVSRSDEREKDHVLGPYRESHRGFFGDGSESHKEGGRKGRPYARANSVVITICTSLVWT